MPSFCRKCVFMENGTSEHMYERIATALRDQILALMI